MNLKLVLFVSVLVFVYFSFSYAATYKGKSVLTSESSGESYEYVAGEISIVLESETDPEDLQELLSEIDGIIIQDFFEDGIKIALVEITLENDLFEAIDDLNESPLLRAAEPNIIMHSGQVHPNDPDYDPKQWALYNYGQNPPLAGVADSDIDAPEAWDYEIEFEAKNLASSIYYYQLISGKFSKTKKMVKLKLKFLI